MPESIDVSVIMPAWKAAAFIERAIQSALASESVNVEVIAVDDASPDATFTVLSQLAAKDPRITARQLPKTPARRLLAISPSIRRVAVTSPLSTQTTPYDLSASPGLSRSLTAPTPISLSTT